MKEVIAFFLFVLCSSADSYSQMAGERIFSREGIPIDFINPYDRMDHSSMKEDFQLLASYGKDVDNRTGTLLFNTVFDDYLNEMIAYIISCQSNTITHSFPIYIVQSHSFNAWAHASGRIMFPIGILSKVSSEDALAFVLCHEMAHVMHDHILQMYLEVKKVNEDEANYKDLNYSKKTKQLNAYSRDQEIEADSLGFELFKNTSFSLDSIATLFDFFNEPEIVDDVGSLVDYLAKGTGFTMKTDEVRVRYNIVDSVYSTHPSPHNRKLYFKRKSKDNQFIEEKKRVFKPTKSFEECQKIATRELTRIYLENRYYELAISNSHHYTKTYGSDETQELYLGHALIQLALCKSNRDYEYLEAVDTYFKSSTYVHQFIRDLSNNDMGYAALRYALSLCDEDPSKDQEFLVSQATRNLVYLDADIDEELISSKPVLSRALLKYKSEQDSLIRIKEELVNNPEKRREIAIRSKNIIKEGYALGIDSILIINPQGISIDISTADLLRVKRSRELRSQIIEQLMMESKTIGLNVVTLDLSLFKEHQIEAYNDYAVLSNWFNEKSILPSDKYYVFNSTFISDIILKYNTPFCAWVLIFNITKSDGLIEKEISYLDFHLVNLSNEKVIFSKRDVIKGKSTTEKIRSSVNGIFTQINRTDY